MVRAVVGSTISQGGPDFRVDHQRGSAACTGGARLVRALLLCRQRTGARQLFGNDELFSLFGFGNVMFDSVGCVQQPRWGRLVRWRLATTFPPVRLLARGPVYTRRRRRSSGWQRPSPRTRVQPGHADPVSSTCDGRRGSAGSSRSLRCLWLAEAPLKTVDLQSGHGSGHEKGALWQRRAPLNTDTRVSASMKHNLDEGLDIWTRVWMTIGWLATVTSLISCSRTVTDEESDKNGRGYGHTEN